MTCGYAERKPPSAMMALAGARGKRAQVAPVGDGTSHVSTIPSEPGTGLISVRLKYVLSKIGGPVASLRRFRERAVRDDLRLRHEL